MQLLQKLVKRKQEKLEINNSIKLTHNAQKHLCTTMSKTLSLINETSTYFGTNENILTTQLEQVNEFKHLLELFNYCLTTFKEEIINLKRLEKTQPHKTLNKKIKKLENIIISINQSFIEIYSKFLVKVQINPKLKEELKQKFIKIINNQAIPLHTNENKLTNN